MGSTTRLQKWLAVAGVASRRAVEPIIKEGRVAVNGAVVTNPAHPVDAEDGVTVDGKPVETEARKVFMVHKPVGVIATASDTHGRETITSLIPDAGRLYPVGRLDAESEGLIVLTNDGELANRLTHPRYEVPKTYQVNVEGTLSAESLQKLETGVELEDGMTAPAEVRVLSDNRFEIIVHEGRNRQIRRMGDAIGHRITRLIRTSIGPLTLGSLRSGSYRELAGRELEALRVAVGLAK